MSSDNDCIVSKAWWAKWLGVFQSDPNVGAISVKSEYPVVGFRDALVVDVPVVHTQTYVEGQLVETIDNPNRAEKHYEALWDGFTLFRRDFCLETGLGDGYFGLQSVLWEPKTKHWRVIVADTPIEHNKHVTL